MHFKDCWYRENCIKAMFNEPEECNNSCLRFLEMVNLVEMSNLPQDKWFPLSLVPGADRAQFIELKTIKDDIGEWVRQGNSLYLYSSNFGNGKTSWAIKLLLAYFNDIWPGNGFRCRGVFVSVPGFILKNKEVISDRDPSFTELKQRILAADLVVWDDIASTKLSDYDHQLLLTYINERVLGRKSNIFTGNADKNQIVTFLGGRLASRVWNGSTIIQFKDVDKRGITL